MKKTVLFLVILFPLFLKSQSYEELKSEFYAEHIQPASMGYHFILAIPPNEAANFPTKSLEIHVVSQYSGKVNLSFTDGKNLLRNIKANEPLVFSSASRELDFDLEVRISELVINQAIILESDVPVSVYVYNMKQTTSDSYMALPVSAWGKEYRHLSTYDYAEAGPYAGGFIIIASEPDTKVRIKLQGKGGDSATTTLMGRQIGETWQVTLNKGEVYYVRGNAKTRGKFDLSGSLITADKPIGLISTHMRVMLPATSWGITNGRNHLAEMMLPIRAWGKEYASIEIKRDRNRGDLFRIVTEGQDNNVEVKWYDKKTKDSLGIWSPQLENAGDVDEYIEADVKEGQHDLRSIRGVALLKGDSPFLPMQYSYSANWDSNTQFDPFMMQLMPSSQMVSSAIFSTISKFTSRLSIIAKSVRNDSNDLKTLAINDTAIIVRDPAFIFNKIPGTAYYYTDLPMNNKFVQIKSNGYVKFCSNLYGVSLYETYGHPVAMETFNLAELDTITPLISKNIDKGNFDITVSDDEGFSERLYLLKKYSSNVYESMLNDTFLSKAIHKEYLFKLRVIDKNLRAKAVFVIEDINGNVAIDSVEYAPKYVASSISFDFGKVRLQTYISLTLTLIDTEKDNIVIKSNTNKNPAFRLLYPTLPSDTLNLELVYEPSLEYTAIPAQADIDTFYISLQNLTDPIVVAVKGKGIVPKIEVDKWNAGTLQVGNFLSLNSFFIKNPGTDTLIISDISLPSEPFKMNQKPSLPIVVPPGDSVKITEPILFIPMAAGDYKDSLVFTSDGQIIDNVFELIGKAEGTSVDEISEETVKVYPNPAGDNITIELGNENPEAKGKLYDVKGSEILNFNIKEQSMQVSLKDIPQGVYNLSIELKGKVISRKITVSR